MQNIRFSRGNSFNMQPLPGAATQKRSSSINRATSPELEMTHNLSIGGMPMMKRMSTRSQNQMEITPSGIPRRGSSNLIGKGKFYAQFGSYNNAPVFGGNAQKTSLDQTPPGKVNHADSIRNLGNQHFSLNFGGSGGLSKLPQANPNSELMNTLAGFQKMGSGKNLSPGSPHKKFSISGIEPSSKRPCFDNSGQI